MKWALQFEILLLYIVTCYEIGIQVTNNNIRQLLSHEEWELLVGSPSVKDFAIIHPVIYTPDKASGRNTIISINGLGQSWLSQIVPRNSIISPYFALLRRHDNGTEDVMDQHRDELECLYSGEKIAVSICDDSISGILLGKGSEYFTIHPLPKRLQNESSVTKAHIMSKRILMSQSDVKPLTDTKRANLTEHKKPVTHDVNLKEGLVDFARDISKVRRTKRGITSSPVFVETAVFIDRDLYHHMAINYPKNTERELIRFVLAMINAVQLLYHDSSLGRVVNFVLKRLEILHTEPIGLHRPHDIDKYLSSFCQWQGRENPENDQDTRHWDHALMLTGLDLYVVNKRGKVSSQVVGLAPVAGMCTKTSSCTVNEGRHFESVYVVAHEIGHNLGMRHDGSTSGNECDPTSYIMSPTLGSGKITWSPCSRNYLQRFLMTSQSNCLLDHGSSGGQLDHSAEGALPGERFDSNHQCMLKYGFGSRHSTRQPLDDVCRDMHCERDRYTWTSHPALEGTLCGDNKWCRGGRCVDKNPLAPYTSTAQKMPGVWSAWHISECASGCLYDELNNLDGGSTGIRVITRSCSNPHLQNERQGCVGPRKRYVACRAAQCLKIPSTTINEFADQICMRAREVDTDLLGTGLQRISPDREEACMVWCRTKKRGSKTRGWTFPDGTSCQTSKNRNHKRSYCIAGRCEVFHCSNSDNDNFLDLPERCYALDTNLIDRDDDIDLLSRNLNVERREENWSSASGCHFNCIAPGIGIRLVNRIRKKMNETSIQLCDPDSNSCGRLRSPYQFATSICSKYKERVRRLSGLGMQISPSVEDPDRPCRVACQDETVNHRFYLVNGENGWFPFGTACSKNDEKSFCVTGKCLQFGKDDTPLHETMLALPLLSRNKRSITNSSNQNTNEIVGESTKQTVFSRYRRNLKVDRTFILSQLKQTDLDGIITKLNFSGDERDRFSYANFQIDLNNPVHIPLDYLNYHLYNHE